MALEGRASDCINLPNASYNLYPVIISLLISSMLSNSDIGLGYTAKSLLSTVSVTDVAFPKYTEANTLDCSIQ
ncbi:MAG: hypothetical protein WBB31_05525 [Saprospiraceae bacterium]